MLLKDLINPDVATPAASTPALMPAEIVDLSPAVRVLVPELDGGRHAHNVANALPAFVSATAAVGDDAWVMLDSEGSVVVVALDPTGAPA